MLISNLDFTVDYFGLTGVERSTYTRGPFIDSIIIVKDEIKMVDSRWRRRWNFDQYHSSQSSVTPQLPQRSNEDVRLEMAKLIKNNRILLNDNVFPHEEEIQQKQEEQEDDEEMLQDREKFMQKTQIFLEKFNLFSFGVTPRVLSIAWERIDKINPTLFYDDDEEYSIQYKKYLEKFPDAVTTVLPTEEPVYSLSMGEYEVTFDDESECDVPDKDESSSVFTTFSNLLFSDNDDFTSSDDESISDETLSTSPIPLEDSNYQREEIDIFTDTDELLPLSIESEDYDSEGEIDVLEELLVDDTISLLENESFYFDHQDDPSFPRPPLELTDVEFDFEPNSGEVIFAVMNNIVKFNKDECFDPREETNVSTNLEDDDYFPFMFVIRIFLPYLIYPVVSPLLLSARSEDTIFDPGIFI
nr:hypothetical protein [Tanacetum cinerariifolium]